MRFAREFLKKNPINIDYLNKCPKILPIQYKILMDQKIKKNKLSLPHSYSNKYDNELMNNTLELVFSIDKKNI
jgi:hypothetical protein